MQISRGVPVGALVFGKRSVQADIFLPNGSRLQLEEMVIVGNTIRRLVPAPFVKFGKKEEVYDRQIKMFFLNGLMKEFFKIKMFGAAGQQVLSQCRVGIIGLGGVGSLVAEYLARLGVSNFCLIDSDIIEESNRSRIVGSTFEDVKEGRQKTLIAKRNILQANSQANIQAITGDVAIGSVSKELTRCDYIFLCADSMRARLVFNAIVHQYLVPGVQLGSKIRSHTEGDLEEVMSVNRPVRPNQGCLWCNQLIDPTGLAKEAKTDEERKDQAYGVEEPNPSVITLNAVCASSAVNDFLLDYLGLRDEKEKVRYEHFHFLRRVRTLVEPRMDSECSECSTVGLRYAKGDLIELPTILE